MPLITVRSRRASAARPSPPTSYLPLYRSEEDDDASGGGRGVRLLGGRGSTARSGVLLLQCPACELQVVLSLRARRLIDEDRLCCPSLSCRHLFRRAW